MRTSNLRKILAVVIILAIVGLGINVATFFLTPYGSKSELMWHDFRETEGLDTVALGTSLMERAYDPSTVDPILGTSSFNMSTPSQAAAESYLGLKEAIEAHDIETVIYGVDFDNFIGEYWMYPGRVYLKEKWKGDDLATRFADLAYVLDGSDWMSDEESINWLFPWTEQKAKKILRNAKMRLDGTPLVEAAETNEPKWHYYGRGYGNYLGKFNYNGQKQEDYVQHYGYLGDEEVGEHQLENLADIADLCAENGIEFIAVAPALPEFSLIGLEDYFEKVDDAIRETVEAHGGEYYNFNLAKEGFYEPDPEHFADCQHYNRDGGTAFSEALAQLLAARRAGEDVSSWFTDYSTRLSRIDRISTVQFTEEPAEGGGCLITARAFAGPDVEVEYKFRVRDEETGKYKMLRDYSTDPTYLFDPEEPGVYKIQVQVRQVGSDEKYERRTQHKVAV